MMARSLFLSIWPHGHINEAHDLLRVSGCKGVCMFAGLRAQCTISVQDADQQRGHSGHIQLTSPLSAITEHGAVSDFDVRPDGDCRRQAVHSARRLRQQGFIREGAEHWIGPRPGVRRALEGVPAPPCPPSPFPLPCTHHHYPPPTPSQPNLDRTDSPLHESAHLSKR